MSEVQIFHATLDGARELEATPFRNEKELQGLFERHLRDLTGIDFVATEHRTGSRHKRRADTLGLDGKQRPVVIEYKLGHGGAAISQGLDYLFWLEDHKGDYRELVRGSLGDDRSRHIDFKNARLLCVAGEFRREDIINAETNTRSIELLCVRRLGESTIVLEWMHGGDSVPKVETEEEARKERQREAGRKAAETRRRNQEKQQTAEEPDYSKYKYWQRLMDTPELHSLFVALRDYARSLGDDVKVNPTQEYIGLWRQATLAFVRLQPRYKRLLVYVIADLERTVLHEGFTELLPEGSNFGRCNLKVFIDSVDKLERAKPLLKRSYDEAG
ncbi:MAG: DUF5655 domain-containing protein [Anaerolineaceae bacterium]|nr:DUF5655 domain-containing protein [Anaerolineaceae bacterium]MDE0327777.1 DUF5655 domain-containing protein [Anaerolineaceae bacterium]